MRQASVWRHLTTPVCPSEDIQSRVERQSPVFRSHSLMVRSREPLMIFGRWLWVDSGDDRLLGCWLLDSEVFVRLRQVAASR